MPKQSREKAFSNPTNKRQRFHWRKLTIKRSPAEKPRSLNSHAKTVNYPPLPNHFPFTHLCRPQLSGEEFRPFPGQPTTTYAIISLNLRIGELPPRIALLPSPPTSTDVPRNPTFGPLPSPAPPLIGLFRRRRKGKRLLFSVLIRFRKPLVHLLCWLLQPISYSRLGLRLYSYCKSAISAFP